MPTRVVCFRLTIDEYESLRAVALALGSPLASLFRDAVAEYVEQAGTTRPIWTARTCNTPHSRAPYTID